MKDAKRKTSTVKKPKHTVKVSKEEMKKSPKVTDAGFVWVG